MRQNTSTIGSGTAGNNVAVNTALASFVSMPPARYRMWGTCRHSLADGIKITGVPGGTIIIPGGAGDTVTVMPFVFDLNAATTINVALNVATGASDTASAAFFMEQANA